jgi:hypothetical protein
MAQHRHGSAVLLALLSGVVGSGIGPVMGQYSPRCRLNGQQVYCAITNYAHRENGWSLTTVVLADDRRLDLEVDRDNCRRKPGETVCPARIRLRDAEGAQTLTGTYRAKHSEAGVTHQYQGGKVDLIYVFMD